MIVASNPLNRVFYYLFLPFLLIFLLYVGAGYFLSISTEFPTANRLLILLGCFLIVVIIFLIVRTAAFEFNRASRTGSTVAYVGPVAMFCALLVFSAYGFLSSSILLFEGPFIAREYVKKAIRTMGKLSSVAPSMLSVSEYETLAGRVTANENQLMSEIANVALGRYCGIGERAKKTIARIRADLPEVDVISGTDRNHNCRDTAYLESLKSAYRELIDKALANSPLARQNRIKDKRDLLVNLNNTINKSLSHLGDAEKLIASLPTFILNIGAYDATAAALDEAANDYNQLVGQLSGMGGDVTKAGLPASLEDTSLAKVSSGLHVFGTIASRIDRPEVILLILFAIISDILATFITFRAIRYQNQVDIERMSALEARELANKRGVDYLWRPRLHPLRRD